ncbi:helix-turn-helix domain-containing protein [Desulfobulbus rhabdoformis]|uniref:helix-turn-helix domain-containing protein n=1 Tax=Desulfobulbus rhabdoformis TaxID=34032 RepID=UPI0019661368|nr:helix-turn-helix domain-containing protein [Desulfobulbus rhabdoformis]MBM9616647.1 helix-turn-helix domain-containing protein [Desulfobulbus rhabdoformis]
MELIKSSKQNLQAAIQNKLLTPEEAAPLVGVTVGTLQVWRSTNRYPLKYVKAGRLVRYRLEDIQSFIESRTVTPAEV